MAYWDTDNTGLNGLAQIFYPLITKKNLLELIFWKKTSNLSIVNIFGLIFLTKRHFFINVINV